MVKSSQDGFPPPEVFDGASLLMVLTKHLKFWPKCPDLPWLLAFKVLTQQNSTTNEAFFKL